MLALVEIRDAEILGCKQGKQGKQGNKHDADANTAMEASQR